MDINYIRFLLACYCSSQGNLAEDTDTARLLMISVKEWMKVKEDVLKDCFVKDENGAICIHPKFKENIKKIVNGLSSDTEKLIEELQEGHERKLQSHQILVEYYKKLKGYDSQPDWDKFYFRGQTRIATETIKKMGLEKATQVMKWISESNFKWWNLKSVLSLYPSYWRALNNKTTDYVESGKAMFDKYNV